MPMSVANGSMGVQYLHWVINEHCLEFTQFSSGNGTGFEDAGDICSARISHY